MLATARRPWATARYQLARRPRAVRPCPMPGAAGRMSQYRARLAAIERCMAADARPSITDGGFIHPDGTGPHLMPADERIRSVSTAGRKVEALERIADGAAP